MKISWLTPTWRIWWYLVHPLFSEHYVSSDFQHREQERNPVEMKVQAVWVDTNLRPFSWSGILSHRRVQDDFPVPCEVMTDCVPAERLAEAVEPDFFLLRMLKHQLCFNRLSPSFIFCSNSYFLVENSLRRSLKHVTLKRNPQRVSGSPSTQNWWLTLCCVCM